MTTALRTASKPRTCGTSYGDEHPILPGELYARHVAFPGDEGHEEGSRPWVIEECDHCADENGTAVRVQYGVPAHFGARVVVDGKPGVIGGFTAAHLLVRLDGSRSLTPWHPTWNVTYPTVDPA